MSTYAEKVARNLRGCDAVSTGTCGGCDTCRSENSDYRVTEDYDSDDDNATLRYTFKASNQEASGLPARLVYYDTEELAEEAAKAQFAEDCANGEFCSEPHFSWSSCGICDSHLGGNREDWHYVAKDAKGKNTIYHHSDACEDCVQFLANGTIPDRSNEEED